MGASQGADFGHISIHALLTESDHEAPPYNLMIHQNFYPRSPYGERPGENHANSQQEKFLSTLSLRRATVSVPLVNGGGLYFYPRSPYGERLYGFCEGVFILRISIHALLTESDILGALWVLSTQIFLSTLSLRRATPSILTRCQL